jgi:hypothetical protein
MGRRLGLRSGIDAEEALQITTKLEHRRASPTLNVPHRDVRQGFNA